jgi:hypothetical protein
MTDLSLENQNKVENQTELIAMNLKIGEDDLKLFPARVILQVKPDPSTGGSFDGINGVAGPDATQGLGRGVVGEGPNAGVAGFSVSGDGVDGFSTAVGKSGVYGENSEKVDVAWGVVGRCDSPKGVGVFGRSVNGIAVSGHSEKDMGVVGGTDSDNKSGVFGFNTHPSGMSFGVRGTTRSENGAGVFGYSPDGNGVMGHSDRNDGTVGISNSFNGSGVFGFNSGEFNTGEEKEEKEEKGHGGPFGVLGQCDSPAGAGVVGLSVGGNAVRGHSQKNDGVVGESNGEVKSGVYGLNSQTDGVAFGVFGKCDAPEGAGVSGRNDGLNGDAVSGFSPKGYGGHFFGGLAPLRLDPANIVGPPTNDNHHRGEFFVDRSGDLFYCKDAGTPGTWFRVALVPV